MSTLTEQVAEVMKEARIRATLTQEELGKRIGIGKERISKYESGKQNPTIATLQKIGDALGIEFHLRIK